MKVNINVPKKDEQYSSFIDRNIYCPIMEKYYPNANSRKGAIEAQYKRHTMEIKRVTVPFESKQVGDKGDFEGYGSTFGNVDFGGDVVMPGAFTNTLREWNAKGQMPLMPWFHDMNLPIGDWKEMREDNNGLFVCGKLWVGEGNKTESAQMVYNLLMGTGPKGMSIGYSVKRDEFEQIEVDGGTQTIRKLHEVDLFELSVVPFGMNPKATVSQAKSLLCADGKIKDIREVEAILRDGGLSCSQAKAFLSSGYKAILRDAGKKEGNALSRDEEAQAQELIESMKKFSNTILKG